MREILFRGKMKSDNGENEKGSWVFGHYCELTDGKKIIPCIYKKGEVIKDTVGQYTGLTDKNGNKIFEGDIVLTYKRNYAVEWKKKDARWILRNGSDQHNLTDVFSFFHNGIIIGNIHDNPELLKGGESDVNR